MIADFAAVLAPRWSERRSQRYGFREAQARASDRFVWNETGRAKRARRGQTMEGLPPKPQGPAQRAGRNEMCLPNHADNSQYAFSLQWVEQLPALDMVQYSG